MRSGSKLSTSPFSLLVILAGLIAPSLLSTGAWADEVYIQAGNQFEAYYDTEIEETVLDDRLDVTLSRGPYSIGAVFLSHSPSDPLRLDPNDFGQETQGLRKRWFRADLSNLSVQLGDVSASFGRGLALQIFEDQTVDFDNGLDGFWGRFEHGPAALEVVGGTNTINDPFHVIKGAQLNLTLPRGINLGLEGVWSDSLGAVAGQLRPGGDRLAGAHLAGALGQVVDFYGEYVLRDYKNFREGADDVPAGHGSYANLSFYLGSLQLVGEFKDFLRYDLPYINPPTAFRSHNTTLLNRGSHTANLRFDDERGGLVEAYVTLNDDTRLNGSFSKTEARHSYQPAWEIYGELERWFGSTEIILRVGETEERIREGLDNIFFERITYAASLVHPLTEIWSLDITAETQEAQESNRRTQPYRHPFDYSTNLVTATLNRSPNMSWGITYEWTDDDREKTGDWVWAEWNIQIGNQHQLMIGGGAFRGGQLCSGGICKLVDPFEGGRIEFLTTF